MYAFFKYSNSPFKERQHQQSALIYLQFRNTPQMVQHCHILLCFCVFLMNLNSLHFQQTTG